MAAASVFVVALGGRTLGSVSSSGFGPPRRLLAALAGLVAALGGLTALIHAGKVTWLDQFGLDHMMPALNPGAPATHGSAGLYQPFSWNTNWWSKVLDLWTYPCSVLVSGLILAACAAVEWRAGRRVAALVPAAAWVTGNAIELLGKHVITRPALYGTHDGVRLHVASFDASFPSGHMIRGTIIAAAIIAVWKRRARWIMLWGLLVGPALIFQSAHTPTDVIGGGLIGLILVAVGTELITTRSPHVRRFDRPTPS